VPDPSFRFVCLPLALIGVGGRDKSWAREMLAEGEIALLADDGGLSAIDQVAHDLGLISIPVIRGERTPQRQQRTVIAFADTLPLVWVAEAFDEETTRWAHERGPMTLLVQADGPLSDDERRRIDRFVATLGRQSE
jgi:hypothetical protein